MQFGDILVHPRGKTGGRRTGKERRGVQLCEEQRRWCSQREQEAGCNNICEKKPAAHMSQLESHDHAHETVVGSAIKKRKKPMDEKANDDGVQVENDFVTKKSKKADDEGDEDNNVSMVKTSLASGGHLVEVGTDWWVLVKKRTGRGSVGQNRYVYISRRVPYKKYTILGKLSVLVFHVFVGGT